MANEATAAAAIATSSLTQVDTKANFPVENPSAMAITFAGKEPHEAFRCVICTTIAWEPVTPACGSHVFCSKCLHKWILQQPSCPTCKTTTLATQIKSLKESNPVAYRIFSATMIRCPKHIQDGCRWTGEYSSGIDPHLSRFCLFEQIDCPQICGIQMKRSALEAHKPNCPNRQIPCEHCKGMFAFQMLEKHTENDCAEIPLRCASIFKNDGCMEMILRKDLDSHRKDKCGNMLVPCPLVKLGACTAEPMPRKFLLAHETKSALEHVALLTTKLTATAAPKQEEVNVPELFADNMKKAHDIVKGLHLKFGSTVDVRDRLGHWYPAVITEIKFDGLCKINFVEWSERHDEFVSTTLQPWRFAPSGNKTTQNIKYPSVFENKLQSRVRAFDPFNKMWRQGRIYDINTNHKHIGVAFISGRENSQENRLKPESNDECWYHVTDEQVQLL